MATGAGDGIDTTLYTAQVYEHERLAPELTKALAMVEEFIWARRRVITGGLAIDFALRLRGGRLYDDERAAFPDYDFITPDPLGDAQDLADQLHRAGLPNVSAIGAMHVQTRRVRVDSRPVAATAAVASGRCMTNRVKAG